MVSSSKFRILLTLKRKNLITLFDSKIGLQSKTEKCGRTLTAEIFSKSDILIKILKAACREVYEELGIDISSLTGKKLISKKRKEQKDFYDVWIVYGEFGLHELSPNKTEVIDVKWMDMKEILLLNQYGYLHPLLDYVDVNFFKEEIK